MSVVRGRPSRWPSSASPLPRHPRPPPMRRAAPGVVATWTEGDKDGIGAAASLQSRALFTLDDGEMTEVFAPDLGTPSIRDLQFVVSDGKTFAEREREDATHDRARRPSQPHLPAGQHGPLGALADHQDLRRRPRPLGGPRRRHVRVADRPPVRPLRDPRPGRCPTPATTTAAAHPGHDACRLRRPLRERAGREPGAVARLQRLHGRQRRLDRPTRRLPDGLALRRGGRAGQRRADRAAAADRRRRQAPRDALARLRRRPGAAASHDRDALRWPAASPPPPTATPRAGTRTSAASPAPASVKGRERLYDVSLMVMAALEDKTYRGAGIASPSMAWVWGTIPGYSGPYHLVWSRDLYQVATAQIAAGDRAAGERALDYLWERQQQPDGCFPQNSNLDGSPHWPNLQLDEVADPILLAWQLGRSDARTWSHVQRAADCILERGPDLAGALGERRGLLARHDRRGDRRARVRGRHRAAQRRRPPTPRATARRRHPAAGGRGLDAHAERPARRNPYYLRLTDDGNADAGTTYTIGDGGPTIDQRARRRPELPRARAPRRQGGRRPPTSSTLPVVDAQLGVRTPNGQFWHRYNYDGYGETADGGPFPRPAATAAGCGRSSPASAASTSSPAGQTAAAARPAGRHRRHRERGPDAARAGLGRPARRPAARRAPAPCRRPRSAGRTRSSSGSRGRSTPGAPWSARTSSPAVTRCAAAERPPTRSSPRARCSACATPGCRVAR